MKEETIKKKTHDSDAKLSSTGSPRRSSTPSRAPPRRARSSRWTRATPTSSIAPGHASRRRAPKSLTHGRDLTQAQSASRESAADYGLDLST